MPHSMGIEYKIDASISGSQFIDLLSKSGLGKRRPIDDHECIEGMINNSNLLVSAWEGNRLIAVARSVTDFHFHIMSILVLQTIKDVGCLSVIKKSIANKTNITPQKSN